MADQLPFDLSSFLVQEEPFAFGAYKIPRYGSLTVAEQIALSGIEVESLSVGQYYARVAAIILRSRLNLDVPPEQLEQIPTHHLKALFDFIGGEARQWEPEREDADAKKSISTGEQSTGSSDLLIPPSNGSSSIVLATARSA